MNLNVLDCKFLYVIIFIDIANKYNLFILYYIVLLYSEAYNEKLILRNDGGNNENHRFIQRKETCNRF